MLRPYRDPGKKAAPCVASFLLFGIVPGETAVDEVGRASHVVRIGRGEKGGDAGDVFGLAEALQRNILQDGIEFCRVVEERFIDGRLDGARRDVVDGDAERRELDG